ncbi:hypothetical protein SEUCBS139899_005868 [Sporothrix eucalyptigena]
MAKDALPKTGLHNVAAEAAAAPLADHDPYPNTLEAATTSAAHIAQVLNESDSVYVDYKTAVEVCGFGDYTLGLSTQHRSSAPPTGRWVAPYSPIRRAPVKRPPTR